MQQSLAEYKFSQNSSRNCLKYWEWAYRFNWREVFTFTRIHTLRLQKCDFLYETGFLPGFKFSTSHFICVLTILLVSFWIDWLGTKEPRFRGPSKSRQMRWYTYKHIHIQKSQMRLAWGTGNPGWSRTTWMVTFVRERIVGWDGKRPKREKGREG